MAELSDPNSIRMSYEGNLNPVQISSSRARQTPMGTTFPEQLKAGMAATGNALGSGLSAAGYSLPGAAVLTAAVSKMGTSLDSSSGALSTAPNSTGISVTAGGSGIGSLGSSSGALNTTSSGTNFLNSASGSTTAGTTGGTSSQQLLAATQQMQELNQVFNLQYLQLQENQQSESRQYTALSNIMKTKSDTAKNSLSNLK